MRSLHAHDRSIGQERTQPVSGVVFSKESAGRPIGGHYEIDALIGRGGMGAVYRCRDVQLGRAVAVQRILPGGAGGEAGLERFRREAHVVASLTLLNARSGATSKNCSASPSRLRAMPI